MKKAFLKFNVFIILGAFLISKPACGDIFPMANGPLMLRPQIIFDAKRDNALFRYRGGITAINFGTGEIKKIVDNFDNFAIGFSEPENSIFLTHINKKTFKIERLEKYNIDTGERMGFDTDFNAIYDIARSPDGEKVIVFGKDASNASGYFLCNLKNNRLIHKSILAGPFTSQVGMNEGGGAIFVNNGKNIISWEYRKINDKKNKSGYRIVSNIKLRKSYNGKPKKTLKFKRKISSPIVLGDDKFFITPYTDQSKIDSVKIYNLRKLKVIKELYPKNKDKFFMHITVDQSSDYIGIKFYDRISDLEKGPTEIWDVRSGQFINQVSGNIRYSPQNKQFLFYNFANDSELELKTWDIEKQYFLNDVNESCLNVENRHGTFRGIDPKSRFIFIDNKDGSIQFFDIKNKKCIGSYYAFADASLFLTRYGHFSGTGNYQDYIHFTDEALNSYTFDQFAMKFYRPETVSRALMGKGLLEGESISEVIAKKPAPVVKIISPDDAQVTNNADVEIKTSFTNIGGGIGNVHFYANGALIKTITDLANKKNTTTKKIRVGLKQGENEIRVVAFNSEGTMSSASDPVTITADYKIEKPSLYVMAIGIDQYNNAELNLNYAVADTKLFTNTISTSAASLFKQIKTNLIITQQETTKSAITSAVKKFTQGIKANDYFILYNSSHGDILTLGDGERKFFIITSNVAFLDNENLIKDAISQDELIAMFGNVAAQNKVLVLDTCHSGKAGKAVQLALLEENTVRTRSLSRKTAMELLRMASGSTVFTASQSIEAAFEGYQGHGLFTFTLAEGLRGAADSDSDKFVTISELKGFVERNVYTRSKRHFKKQQIPYINIGTMNIPIAAY